MPPKGSTDGWKPGFRQRPTNRVATVTDQGKGQYGLTWDALGNLASVGAFDGQRAKGFVYSPEDRLLEARDAASGVVTRFAYDGNGERVLSWRRSGDGSLMDARLYLRDEDGRVLSEYLLHDGEEAVLDHEYLYAGARLAAQLDWSGGAALVRYVAVDHLGSTRVVLASDGTVLDTLEYYPYGGLRQGGDVPPTTYLYTGHERDLGETSTQLDYMHARYYSYNLGRFTSIDPVGGEVGLSQGWNRYGYVKGNPIRLVDPDGRFGLDGGTVESEFRHSGAPPGGMKVRTPEGRAFELAMGGAMLLMVTAPVAAAALPAEMVADAAATGTTGLVVGGVAEVGTDHPADVRVRNTLISGGVGTIGGPLSRILGAAGGLRALAGKAIAALAGAAEVTKLQGAPRDGATAVAIVGSGKNAAAAHTVAQLVPQRWRALVENAVLAGLEIAKTFIIRDVDESSKPRKR